MRTQCKYYESRTYATGESVQKCDLNLAPEAPWRCPENCAAFRPRLADVGWTYGGLHAPKAPPEPPNLDEEAIALLAEAQDIVNAVGPGMLAEFKRLDEQRSRKFFAKGASTKLPKGKKKRKK
jgi:hypothetical protein